MAHVDLFDVRSLLSEEELAVLDTVTRFVEKEALPLMPEAFERGVFPMSLVPKMAALGVFGANYDGYGCAGMNSVSYGLMMQALEAGDSGLRSFASVQSALTIYPVMEFGSDGQKERWLPDLVAGKKLACFGLTEPDFGSDPNGMLTTATETDSGYVLQGTKRWITNGSIADVAIVWARFQDRIQGFLVTKGTPGYTTRDIPHKMSLRASVTSELFLDDCEIPKENRLPGADSLKAALQCLNQARYGICWGTVGAAMACYQEALAYAGSRIVFQRPIGGFQLVQEKLVDMITEITKAQLLNLQLGRLKDRGTMHHAQVSLAKRNNVRIALAVAREARDILGANGISLEYHTIRHMLNLESVKTYEGTDSIHTLTVGRHITGLNAFS